MPKLLFLNPQVDSTGSGSVTGDHWTLPDDTDVEALRQRLEAAIDDGKAATVAVLLPGGDGLQTQLTVNGSLLATVAVVEIAPPGGD